MCLCQRPLYLVFSRSYSCQILAQDVRSLDGGELHIVHTPNPKKQSSGVNFMALPISNPKPLNPKTLNPIYSISKFIFSGFLVLNISIPAFVREIEAQPPALGKVRCLDLEVASKSRDIKGFRG